MAENKNKTRLTKTNLGVLAFIIVALFLLLKLDTTQPGGNLDNEARTIERSCQTDPNKETCYAKEFEILTKNTDRDYAFEVLRKLQRLNVEANGCHFIAHAISTAETEKDPSKWKELLNTAPPDCSYGGVHGVMEAYAATFPNGRLPESEVANLCNNPDTNNCTHGLGHLTLVITDNDIPKSLSLCDSLPHDSIGKFECHTGVFMERITAFNLVIHGLGTEELLNWPVRLPELEELCRAQSGIYSIACWKEIVHVALVKFHNDPQKIVDFCETAPGEDATRQCIDHSLGIMAAGYNFNLTQMKPLCDANVEEPDFTNRCYAHLVASTLSTIPHELPAAISFCGSLEESYQNSCFAMVGNSMRLARQEIRDSLAQECLAAPKEMRDKCENGGYTGIVLYSGD